MVTPSQDLAVHMARSQDTSRIVFSMTRHAFKALHDKMPQIDQALDASPKFTFCTTDGEEPTTDTTVKQKKEEQPGELLKRLKGLSDYPLAGTDPIVESIIQQGIEEASLQHGFKLNKAKRPDMRQKGIKKVMERLD